MIDTIYHTGFLALDRVDDKRLDVRARALLKLSEAGQVSLYQRKLDALYYEYHSRPIKGAR